MVRDPIADLVHRYADAVVRFDTDQWAATWTDDAVWELARGHEIAGREAIVAVWSSTMEGFRAVFHTVSNGTHQLDESAGSGVGRWYVQEFVQPREGASLLVLGHYDDTYAFVDGGWSFSSRRLVMHYAGPPDLSAPMADPRR